LKNSKSFVKTFNGQPLMEINYVNLVLLLILGNKANVVSVKFGDFSLKKLVE